MSIIGSPLETSVLQAAQAQQTASKARDRQRAVGESARRFADVVDLRVAGVESAEAVRGLPRNDSGQAEQDDRGEERQPPGSQSGRRPLDVRA
jgi:hypothetical protein